MAGSQSTGVGDFFPPPAWFYLAVAFGDHPARFVLREARVFPGVRGRWRHPQPLAVPARGSGRVLCRVPKPGLAAGTAVASPRAKSSPPRDDPAPPRAGISPLSGSLCLYFGVFKCYMFLFGLCTQDIRGVFCLSVRERICQKSFPR